MSNSRKKNIAELYLKHVGIRFSRKYFSETVNDNPFPNSFEGIRRILLEFNIRSQGIVFSREEVVNIEDPFITTLPSLFDGFVLVTETSDQNITIQTEYGESKRVLSSDFLSTWDGTMLFPEVNEISGEPEYFRNKIRSIAECLKLPLTIIVVSLLIGSAFVRLTSVLFSIILVVVYCAGTVTSCLLLMEGMNVYSPLVRKICHSDKKVSCSKVLESRHSKLFGLIGWSEIGFVYFAGSFLFFLVYPQCVNLLFLTSVIALPYTLWSVWYQWFIVKKWCPLCLTVQALLWGQFFVFIIGSTRLQISGIIAQHICAYVLCMAIPAIALWWNISWISKAKERSYYKRALLKLKSEDSVFRILLAESEVCDVPVSARHIILGNKEAENTITVISNPYCHYCASFHSRLVKFLSIEDDYKAELVFVGESVDVIKKLISAYLIYDQSKAESIYAEWFKNYEKVFERYSFTPDVDATDVIFQLSVEWYNSKKPIGTPTVFINNRLLPDAYVLEDLHVM